jgi:hypothetical protein
MIYSAKVTEQGTVEGTWKVSPAYTRVDGQPAPDITALASDGIKPDVDDIVLCAESINDFEHNSVRSFDDNGGSNPIIIAVFSQLFTTLCDVTIEGDVKIKGKTELGDGSKKMVIGDEIKTQLQKVLDQLTQLRTDFSTWTPVPHDGGAALKAVIAAGFALKPDASLTDILSENNKLD